MLDNTHRRGPFRSLSARRAWIEISKIWYCGTSIGVALRKESVDRNPPVDTSSVRASASLSARRAWIEIGSLLVAPLLAVGSLSARRAWIEIGAKADSVTKWSASLSARRAWIEIVAFVFGFGAKLSLSARRAWIEMCAWHYYGAQQRVALRKESVDRNMRCSSLVGFGVCRSPQGERG